LEPRIPSNALIESAPASRPPAQSAVCCRGASDKMLAFHAECRHGSILWSQCSRVIDFDRARQAPGFGRSPLLDAPIRPKARIRFLLGISGFMSALWTKNPSITPAGHSLSSPGPAGTAGLD